MNISGIVKSSFIDYPGAASTVIFLGGCNFKCGYCHNPEIVWSQEGAIALPDFFSFLERRRRFVDAVCISGGEPTLHKELYQVIRQIRDLGFQIKLDTNGTNPEILGRLIGEGMLDHVAMDIKGPWEKYSQITRVKTHGGAVRESLAILMALAGSSVDGAGSAEVTWELRTTVCRELLSEADIRTMAVQLSGADLWYLQTFKKQERLLDEEGSYSAYTPAEMEQLRQAVQELQTVKQVLVRP